MKIDIPELSLVVLIGTSGSGKSSFARKHFLPTEVISSDYCRGLVSDDENAQYATSDAFEVLNFIAKKRLAAGRLTVIDATNVQPESRKGLIALARAHHCLPVAIVLELPEKVCHERNQARPDRQFGSHVVRQQASQLKRSIRGLKDEGFRYVYRLKSVEDVDAATIERKPLWNNKKAEHGPFDIIGDIHGCFDELVQLLTDLGYVVTGGEDAPSASPPEGRRAIFVGDLVDRGPKSPAVLKLVMSMVAAGHAYCVPGNHEEKLKKFLFGKNVQRKHGLEMTIAQIENEPQEWKSKVGEFIDGLVSHYVFDDGKLVVAHAGMKEELQGRGSGAVRQFALFGETTGETDEFGLPVRYDWAAEYRGKAMVVYGHTPVPEATWLNRTICIDTGCVFGGQLTALRYPEKELVSVPAKQMYYEPARPIARPDANKRPYGDLLDIDDVAGKRIVSTRIHNTVTVREENAAAALEVMSRFAADPQWLIYLPPTMSPSETCETGEYLEHPREAFTYFQNQGVAEVICEEKHMGSRAVVIVCRDGEVAKKRFGALDGRDGIIYTRTGRLFFADRSTEQALLDRLRGAMDKSGLWEKFNTNWICLDAELMPWSAKAQELLRSQYGAVGASARASLDAVVAALEKSLARDGGTGELLKRFAPRRGMVTDYVAAYRQYCWDVDKIEDYTLAPFHILATEGTAHVDKDHVWHMETIAELCAADPGVLMATPYRIVNLGDEASVAGGIAWWEELTAKGGEGMVVKPKNWVVRSKRGLVQPAVKCRGREYLRIIYGPEYSAPENLDRLRSRGLGAKRSLALREFALGLEALHRFVEGEPLYRVHECVFGVLALESEPVDPRL
jgi:protein phosphatase